MGAVTRRVVIGGCDKRGGDRGRGCDQRVVIGVGAVTREW